MLLCLLVSNNAQIDCGVSMFLDGGQQSGAIGVSDLARVEVIFWIQQLDTQTHISSTKQQRKKFICF